MLDTGARCAYAMREIAVRNRFRWGSHEAERGCTPDPRTCVDNPTEGKRTTFPWLFVFRMRVIACGFSLRPYASYHTETGIGNAFREDAKEEMGMTNFWQNTIRGFVLKDLLGMSLPALTALCAFVLLGVLLLYSGKRSWSARSIAQAALCVACGFILSCIRLYRMPNGGSVVLCAMLPLIAYSAAAGFSRGLAACVCYGLLQIAQGAWIIHPAQGFLDYCIAYAVLCIGCIAPVLPVPKRLQLPIACILAAIARFFVHVIAGVVFFAQDAVDAGQVPFVYSALYNLYLFPEAILCAILSATPAFARVYQVLARGAAERKNAQKKHLA